MIVPAEIVTAASLAAWSKIRPNHSISEQIEDRISGACSPMPPLNTTASA